MRQIAAELIREKALRLLQDEIPHGIAVTIEQMKEREQWIFDIELPLSVNVILTKDYIGNAEPC